MTKYLNKKKIAILGSGGHASICSDILKIRRTKPICVVVSQKNEVTKLKDYKYKLTDKEFIKQFQPNDIQLINGIGIVPGKNRHLRKRLFNKYCELGYEFITLIHPSAIISDSAVIESGSQIMAGSIIQCNVTIKRNSIINSGSIIEHDCFIDENCHIAPGTILCGNVKIEQNVFLPAGSIIKPNSIIDQNYKKRTKNE